MDSGNTTRRQFAAGLVGCGALGAPLVSISCQNGHAMEPLPRRSRKDFQPMNANFGLFPALTERKRGRDKKHAYAQRALSDLDGWIHQVGLGISRGLMQTSSR